MGQAAGEQDIFVDLNDRQIEAVRALKGPIKIVAGAGSGKTLTLTRRMAYGIATGEYNPGEIMALSFTRRAALQLSSRLTEYGVHGVYAGTFHQAALGQLKFFWEAIHGNPPRQIVQNKVNILQDAAEMAKLSFPEDMLSSIAAEIEWVKQNGYAIQEYDEYAASRPLAAKTCQVRNLMLAYEDLKAKRKLIDFEDILTLTVGMLSAEPATIARVRDKYRVFLVDEFQDVSPLQFELLRLWVGRRRDICVVGDPNQCIYSFAGAKKDYLVRFDNYYPGAYEVSLTRNYRSAPEIVSLSNRIIGDYTIVPGSERKVGSPIQWHHFDNQLQEMTFLTGCLKNAPASCSVLYRTMSQGERLAKCLDRSGVVYKTQESKSFYDIPAVQVAFKRIIEKSLETNCSAAEVTKEVVNGIFSQRPAGFTSEYEGWVALQALKLYADDFVGDISAFATHLLEMQRSRQEIATPFVTLATLHATKGLEWDTVYLMGVEEGLIPHTEGEEDEERRLFYVGITRAKNQLIMTSSRHPSPYLLELELPCSSSSRRSNSSSMESRSFP